MRCMSNYLFVYFYFECENFERFLAFVEEKPASRISFDENLLLFLSAFSCGTPRGAAVGACRGASIWRPPRPAVTFITLSVITPRPSPRCIVIGQPKLGKLEWLQMPLRGFSHSPIQSSRKEQELPGIVFGRAMLFIVARSLFTTGCLPACPGRA